MSISLSLPLPTLAAGDDSHAVDEEAPLLVEGKWSGVYKLHLSGRNDATFLVDDDEAGVWNITMTVDLRPRENFTYTFDEIVLDGDSLWFTFGETGQERECKLVKQGNSILKGGCFYKSDPDEKEQATIEMRRPPPDSEPDIEEDDALDSPAEE